MTKGESRKKLFSFKIGKKGRNAADKSNKTTLHRHQQEKNKKNNFVCDSPMTVLENKDEETSSGNLTDDESVNENVNYNQFEVFGFDDPRSDFEEEVNTYDDLSLSQSNGGPRKGVNEDRVVDGDEHQIDINHQLSSELEISVADKKKAKKERKRKALDEEWKSELQKDVVALMKEVKRLRTELNELKRELKKKPLFEPAEEDDDDFSLLPRLPLKKKSRFMNFETNINSNKDFQRQLIAKLSPIGGTSIKNNVINIFRELFTAKLRTKVCWNGSPAGRGKIPFHPFKGIRDVIRRSVARNFKCTRSVIDNECKLRFKQADKDYQRERAKNLL